MEKTTGKISKTTARRKRTNQEGDENETRRRRTDENWNINLRGSINSSELNWMVRIYLEFSKTTF
jgi:hypothetical protein